MVPKGSSLNIPFGSCPILLGMPSGYCAKDYAKKPKTKKGSKKDNKIAYFSIAVTPCIDIDVDKQSPPEIRAAVAASWTSNACHLPNSYQQSDTLKKWREALQESAAPGAVEVAP